MHSQGILGFPRRIFDSPIIYFSFNWFSSFGILFTLFSLIIFITSFFI
jgi:hypothetical protein